MVKQYVPSRWIAMNRIGLVAKEPSVHMSRESLARTIKLASLGQSRTKIRLPTPTPPRAQSITVEYEVDSEERKCTWGSRMA